MKLYIHYICKYMFISRKHASGKNLARARDFCLLLGAVLSAVAVAARPRHELVCCAVCSCSFVTRKIQHACGVRV